MRAQTHTHTETDRQTNTHTDHGGDLTICPMLCDSNGALADKKLQEAAV